MAIRECVVFLRQPNTQCVEIAIVIPNLYAATMYRLAEYWMLHKEVWIQRACLMHVVSARRVTRAQVILINTLTSYWTRARRESTKFTWSLPKGGRNFADKWRITWFTARMWEIIWHRMVCHMMDAQNVGIIFPWSGSSHNYWSTCGRNLDLEGFRPKTVFLSRLVQALYHTCKMRRPLGNIDLWHSWGGGARKLIANRPEDGWSASILETAAVAGQIHREWCISVCTQACSTNTNPVSPVCRVSVVEMSITDQQAQHRDNSWVRRGRQASHTTKVSNGVWQSTDIPN